MTDDLDRDLDKIAADIPHETSGFAELRRLLGLLPSPLGPLIPGASAAQLADPAAGDSSTGMSTPVSDVMSGASPGSQPGWDQALASGAITDAFTNLGIGQKGFGSAVLRYLLTGIYNSDFALLPRDPASNIGAANPLPFWTFVQRSGSSISAKSVADATLASGYKIAFEMSGINGSAGDDAYIEQIVPIVGGLSQVFAGVPVATFLNGAVVSNAQHYIEAQYLAADGVTTVGTAGLFAIQSNSPSFGGGVAGVHADLWLKPGGGTGIPGATWTGLPVPGITAEFLRIRLGLRRNSAAVTQAQTTYVTDAHLNVGRDFNYLVDRGNGTNGVTEMSQSGFQLTISVAVGNSTGATPGALLFTAPTAPGGTSALALSPSADLSGVLSISGTKPVVRVYNANATWTHPATVQFILVECIGGGGQAGGSAATVAGAASTPGGGGGGGYSRKLIDASLMAGDGTIVVGAGGSTGGVGANGQAGGNSSFAATGITTVVANGGGGGSAPGTSSGTGPFGAPGVGGASTGGDFNATGDDGGLGIVSGGVPVSDAYGGGTHLGGITRGPVSSNAAGIAGSPYGGGGSAPTTSGAAGVSRAGGAGAVGVVIVTEFYGP